MAKRDILNYLGQKIGELELPNGTSEETWQAKLAMYAKAPPTQYEKDYERYIKRAQAKNLILAEMAAENMARVRSGTWTVNDLASLTQDTDLKKVLDDLNALSFELAASKLQAVSNPLITDEIKTNWLQKLQNYFYL